ncbi:MAG: polymer-forming cytoskeletal protein [Anaerolineae bacterium]|nr:polymer-forming cytoskeletal protein [Anaerolineae bacterium]
MFRRSKLAPLTAGKIDNLVGSNTSFDGIIKSDGNIRVDGIYQGRIETAGNVIVGPTARVVADIVANMVQVWGAVRGDITAKGRLEILPDGRVWGNVQVVSLLIDEGGMFLGQCKMAGESVEPLTLPEPPPAEPSESEEEAAAADKSETESSAT